MYRLSLANANAKKCRKKKLTRAKRRSKAKIWLNITQVSLILAENHSQNQIPPYHVASNILRFLAGIILIRHDTTASTQAVRNYQIQVHGVRLRLAPR
jgi:hypothetical protein